MNRIASNFGSLRRLLIAAAVLATPLLKVCSDPVPCSGTLKIDCPSHLTEFGTGASVTQGGNLKDVKDKLSVEVVLNGDCPLTSCFVVVTATYFNSHDPNDPAIVDVRQLQFPNRPSIFQDVNGLAFGAIEGSDVIFEATVFCGGAIVRDINGNPLTMKCTSKVKKAKEDKK